MRFARIAALALIGLMVNAPAVADSARSSGPSPGYDLHAWFPGIARESDIAALADYLRQALTAAAQGREIPPPPEELKKGAERLADEIKARGTLGVLLLLTALEEQAKALLRKKSPSPRKPLPPVSPLIRVSSE